MSRYFCYSYRAEAYRVTRKPLPARRCSAWFTLLSQPSPRLDKAVGCVHRRLSCSDSGTKPNGPSPCLSCEDKRARLVCNVRCQHIPVHRSLMVGIPQGSCACDQHRIDEGAPNQKCTVVQKPLRGSQLQGFQRGGTKMKEAKTKQSGTIFLLEILSYCSISSTSECFVRGCCPEASN